MNRYNPTVSLFPKITETIPFMNNPIESVLGYMKAPTEQTFIDRIAAIRRAKLTGNEDLKSQLKRQLYYFTPSGVFQKRNNESLIEYSGLVDIDIDGLSPEKAPEVRNRLARFPWILAAYVSASGCGVAALARVAPDSIKHKFHWSQISFALSEYALSQDRGTHDLARARFYTHDPDLYYNPHCRIFDPAQDGYIAPLSHPDTRKPEAGENLEYFSAEENFRFAFKKAEERYGLFQSGGKGGNAHHYIRDISCFCNRAGTPAGELAPFLTNDLPAGNSGNWQMEREKVSRGVYRLYQHEFGSRRNPKRQKQQDRTNSNRGIILPEIQLQPASSAHIPTDNQNPLLNEYWVSLEAPPPPDTPYVKFNNATIAGAGTFIVVSGAANSGKTSVEAALIAGNVMQTKKFDGMLGYETRPNSEGHAVIYLDTEQRQSKVGRMVARVYRRAGLDLRNVPYFLPYSIAGMDEAQERFDFMHKMVELAYQQFGGIRAIFIDGIADLLTSVNNEQESESMAQYQRKLAQYYRCFICNVLHTTHGSEKLRGHTGSVFSRKCNTDIRLGYNKQDKLTEVSFAKMRDGNVHQNYGIRWEDALGDFTETNSPHLDDPTIRYTRAMSRLGWLRRLGKFAFLQDKPHMDHVS